MFKVTSCFYNDLKNLMNVHNIKSVNLVANITDDNILKFVETPSVIHFTYDIVEENGLHKPTQDELEDLFRKEDK